MGGFGSGRDRYATTPTVEECRSLDIDKFTESVKHPGYGGPVYWGDPDDPEASIKMLMLSDDHLTALKEGGTLETASVEDAPDPVNGPDDRTAAVYLTYTITHPRTDESRDVSSLVSLEYTDCNFGGVRPWFRCPSCGDRRRKLYQPPQQDKFACRGCYGLGYRSSRTSGMDLERAEQRYRKAFAKADAENRHPHPNNLPYTPTRPKGMHQDTFDDLLADVRTSRREWDERMNEQMREFLGRYKDEPLL